MKRTISLILFCLCMLLSGLLQAQQQEVLLITSETLDEKARATPSKMYLSENMLLMETEERGKPVSTLYNADKQEIYIIDHKKKEYYLLDKAEMEAMAAKMKEAQQQMEQQLQMMPEAQRKVIEKQMQKVMGMQSPVVYTQVATDVPVNSWSSDRFDGNSDGQLRHEVYVASYKELGRDKDDFKALISLFTLMQNQLKEMSQSMPMLMAFNMDTMPGGEAGIPVKTVYYDDNGKPQNTSTINSIEETTVSEDKWQVPAKYKQKKFSAMK